jgi:predicted TIM-barrel fold metal-dependent hydrolase
MDLRISNPSHLYNLLQDERTRKAKIVLTHGGYPYTEEAAFLTSAYPNVYLDFSQTIPFISIGVKNRLQNLLEMAPTTKIMYGSDGFNIPEIHWFSAVHTEMALKSLLAELKDQGICTEEEGLRIAQDFLADNAKRLYKI